MRVLAQVEIRWAVAPDEKGEEKRGYFINECVAERIGGVDPAPEPLRLISNGYVGNRDSGVELRKTWSSHHLA